jgi:hypothetical protein
MKFTYFLLTIACISLPSYAMFKNNLLSLLRSNDDTIIIDYNKKKLATAESNNNVGLEGPMDFKDKKKTSSQKITRTPSLKIEKI